MIAWSISVVNFNLILRVVLLNMITLNLFQFVTLGVMVGIFCVREGVRLRFEARQAYDQKLDHLNLQFQWKSD